MFIRFAIVFLIGTMGSVQAGRGFAIDQLVYQLRNPATDSKQFRNSLEKIGEYLALEVFDHLEKKDVSIETLTGAVAAHSICDETPVLVTILRAGLPLCFGAHQVFPDAPIGYLAISRNEETLQPKVDYVALPEIEGKTVIIVDTMIATAGSMLATIEIIEKYRPKRILVIGAIASEYAMQKIEEHDPNIRVFAAAVDPELNAKGYIVPGLGDAGDRSFGEKFIR